MSPADPTAVLEFWFGQTDPSASVEPRMDLWFGGAAEQDDIVRARFGATHTAAARGQLDSWRQTPAGRLAWVVVLDQFSRQIHRGAAAAFANDAAALASAMDALERGWDREMGFFQRAFLYLPFEHSEDLDTQVRSVALFRQLHDDAPPELKSYGATMLDFAEQHHALIQRFGRFPHRNDDLSRTTTVEEFQFLLSPGGGYGKARR